MMAEMTEVTAFSDRQKEFADLDAEVLGNVGRKLLG